MSVSPSRAGWGVVAAIATGCAALTLLGFAGRWWWIADLATHFPVQLAMVLAAAMLAFALGRRWEWVGVCVAAILVNATHVVPLYRVAPAAAQPAAAPLRLVMFNLNKNNTRYAAVGEYLAGQQADVVVVNEASDRWQQELSRALSDYHYVGASRTDSFGIAVWTRAPLDYQEVLQLGDRDVPAIAVAFEHGGQRVDLLALHTFPPVNEILAVERDAMLRGAAQWAREREGHVIVAGDLNATPWSHGFRAITSPADDGDRGSLIDSMQGYGVQPSWPEAPALLSIPIDHCLHGPTLTTVERATGPHLGSDHRPLLVTLARAARAKPAAQGRESRGAADAETASGGDVAVPNRDT